MVTLLSSHSLDKLVQCIDFIICVDIFSVSVGRTPKLERYTSKKKALLSSLEAHSVLVTDSCDIAASNVLVISDIMLFNSSSNNQQVCGDNFNYSLSDNTKHVLSSQCCCHIIITFIVMSYLRETNSLQWTWIVRSASLYRSKDGEFYFKNMCMSWPDS